MALCFFLDPFDIACKAAVVISQSEGCGPYLPPCFAKETYSCSLPYVCASCQAVHTVWRYCRGLESRLDEKNHALGKAPNHSLPALTHPLTQPTQQDGVSKRTIIEAALFLQCFKQITDESACDAGPADERSSLLFDQSQPQNGVSGYSSQQGRGKDVQWRCEFDPWDIHP